MWPFRGVHRDVRVLPSGLVLYWVVNNLLSITQQYGSSPSASSRAQKPRHVAGSGGGHDRSDRYATRAWWRGIVRISGPSVTTVAAAVLGFIVSGKWQPRSMPGFRCWRPGDRRRYRVVFAGPASFTGEHPRIARTRWPRGPRSPVATCARARRTAAEPGGFSRRAFLNDKLDLAQAEAIADLIDSQTQPRRSAMRRSVAVFQPIHASSRR